MCAQPYMVLQLVGATIAGNATITRELFTYLLTYPVLHCLVAEVGLRAAPRRGAWQNWYGRRVVYIYCFAAASVAAAAASCCQC